jgi:protoheme ferro-lyase
VEPAWIVIWTALGTAAGWATVKLVLRPGIRRVVHAAPVTGLVVLAPMAAAGEPVPTAGALLGAAVGVVAGWTAASYLRLPAPDRTPERAAPVPVGSPRRRAVVYFTHGEPETYEPEPWVNMLHELDATVPGFPPKPVWPFILAGIKRSFGIVGSSPHGRIHAQTMAEVAAAVGRPDVDWHLSFLDADPPLHRAVSEAVRAGATELVLLTVFLTDSDHTAEADKLDAAMGLSAAGLRVMRTPVLWDDARLARMVAEKVLRAAGDRDRSTVGVMLVGHGQPIQWDAEHPTETQQEQAFRAAIRSVLVQAGFRADLVSEAWMSFRDPKVPDRVRELAQRGARTVIGVPVTISADSLHSLHDTPALVRKGAHGTGLEVLDVGGWNTEPLLVELLADRTRQALAELEAGADSQR